MFELKCGGGLQVWFKKRRRQEEFLFILKFYPDAMIASVLAVLFSHKFPRAKKPYLEKDICVCVCV
jgi:hypothetical protein